VDWSRSGSQALADMMRYESFDMKKSLKSFGPHGEGDAV